MSDQYRLDIPSLRLDWLPDETLFSWCSRYHQLSANSLARVTCRQLFGHTQIGSAHDIPARIDEFLSRNSYLAKSSQELILARTMLPFYLPFKSNAVGEDAVASMGGSGVNHLRFRLGMPSGGLGAAHPLKACPQCMAEDRQNHGWAYWHWSHQFPGIWYCALHKQPLLISTIKIDQAARFQWGLPTHTQLYELPQFTGQQVRSQQQKAILRIANHAMRLVETGSGTFADINRLANVLRNRLMEKGLASSSGRIRWRELLKSLQAHRECVGLMPEFIERECESLLNSQISNLVTGRSTIHPLKYLVYIDWLYGDWKKFQSEYMDYQVISETEGPSKPSNTCSKGLIDERYQIALDFLAAGKLSPSAIARKLGVDPSTIAAWAAKNQIETQRRPKVLHAKMRERAVSALRIGVSKNDVAKECGISVVTVTRLLRSVPGLADQWHLCRQNECRQNSRYSWINVLPLAKALGVTMARRLVPAAYIWLYRNDRDWLDESLNSVESFRLSCNYSHIRLERADLRCANAIYSLAARNNIGGFSGLVEFDHLKCAIPNIKKVIRMPEKWPVSAHALFAIL